MRFLLDEDLSPKTADSLAALGEDFGYFEHITTQHGSGRKDPEIPPICRAGRFDSLITANVKDFGARKLYYQALLSERISVVVVRPGKVKFDPLGQVHIISSHLRRVIVLLQEARGPVLIVVTPSEARIRTLEELLAEFA
ncbi:MAG: DUF5615 family PIN-like protein [Actinomycetota bacterium]